MREEREKETPERKLREEGEEGSFPERICIEFSRSTFGVKKVSPLTCQLRIGCAKEEAFTLTTPVPVKLTLMRQREKSEMSTLVSTCK